MSPAWSRLIRFVPADDSSSVLYGEPRATSYTDIGALADQGKLEAAVIESDASGPLSDSARVTERVVKVGKLLAPVDDDVCRDVKGVGRNYGKHDGVGIEQRRKLILVAEGGEAPPPIPSIFLISTTTLTGYGDIVQIPKAVQDGQVDYEVELVAVIGKDTKDVSPEEALDAVVGYTIGDDISARRMQLYSNVKGGLPQLAYSKGFDKFAPIGPCIVNSKLIPDVGKLQLTCKINDEVRQDAPASELLFGIGPLISVLSQGTTVRRGTVIFTGTPAGIGCIGPEEGWKPLKPGDKIELSISEIGVLRHGIEHP